MVAAGSRLTSILAALLLLGGAGTAAAGPSLLFDPATGEVISQDRVGEPWYPASLTKLMTAYVVFQKIKSGALKLDQKITVSQLAARQPPSKLGLKPGGTIPVDLALQSLLVYSANDIAYVLAEGAGGGSVQNFVRMMNAEAKRLGMTGTYYANPNGLFDARQVTSARDIAVLASAILREFPEHAHYFSQPVVAIGKTKLRNRNMLIRTMKTADGMKTGYVCNSGYNLVASATQNGRKLVAIVLGAPGAQARADQAEMMLTAGFAKPPQPKAPRIASIANDRLGNMVPADLTQKVCKGKPPGQQVRATELSGWGVSLGSYNDAPTADMALRGRLLGAREVLQGGTSGIVKLPGSNGFSAMVWDLDQSTSLSLCGFFRDQKAFCDVMTPENFAHIATLARANERKVQPAGVQGGDIPIKKKKKKRRN
jgi:D-alanyl-D-alanine carboxypeptidase